MSARTAEPVVQIEVAKGRIEIVAPQQTNHATAKPNTFWIAGRTSEGVLRLGEFIDFPGLFCRLLTGCRRLVGRLGVGALGKSRTAGRNE